MLKRRPLATILVGPSALFREGLSRILSGADFRILASTERIDSLASVLLQHDPLLLIIDAGSNLDSATEPIQYFKKQSPGGRIAVLVEDYQLEEAFTVYRAGANGCFSKLGSCDAFVKSLQLIILGETFLPRELLDLLVGGYCANGIASISQDSEFLQLAAPNSIKPPEIADDGGCKASPNSSKIGEGKDSKVPELSARERHIVSCLAQGDSNKMIARKSNIAEATVKVHVKAILRKLRVRNRTQVAVWALTNFKNDGLERKYSGNCDHAGMNGGSSDVAELPIAYHKYYS